MLVAVQEDILHNMTSVHIKKKVNFDCLLTLLKTSMAMCFTKENKPFTYTNIRQRSEVRTFFIFVKNLKDVSYANQGCIYLIKNTVKTVILWKIITI